MNIKLQCLQKWAEIPPQFDFHPKLRLREPAKWLPTVLPTLDLLWVGTKGGGISQRTVENSGGTGSSLIDGSLGPTERVVATSMELTTILLKHIT